MAITTHNERLACINGVGHVFLPPMADGAIGETDRYNFTFLQYHVAGPSEITIEDVYELLESCCENMTLYMNAIMQTVVETNNMIRMLARKKVVDAEEDNWKKLYSAIRDMRRDLLRGKGIDRRDE